MLVLFCYLKDSKIFQDYLSFLTNALASSSNGISFTCKSYLNYFCNRQPEVKSYLNYTHKDETPVNDDAAKNIVNII